MALLTVRSPLVRRYKYFASSGVIGMAFGYFGEASANS
jgi:hypothetical protein